MAGLFGLFNFEKDGPGISKNAPKKKTFVVFFETYFRNFWKFIIINLVYNILALPQLTSGLASVGITHVARNTARDKHSFGLSDFFDTVKKNWKQALPTGIINTIIYLIILFDLYFFYTSTKGIFGIIGLGVALSVFIIFSMMNYFMWTLMITFKFSLKQIYKNSFNFAVLNLKKNFLCFVTLLLVYAIYVGILFLFQKYWMFVLAIELFVYALTFPGFKFLLIQYCCFPAIKKYIIDPYYEEHPDEDIEKRKDLGIDVDEPNPVITNEDGEEETENVFED